MKIFLLEKLKDVRISILVQRTKLYVFEGPFSTKSIDALFVDNL